MIDGAWSLADTPEPQAAVCLGRIKVYIMVLRLAVAATLTL
jgi:hypothetical protein